MTPKELFDWIKARIKEDAANRDLSPTAKDEYYEVFIASNPVLEMLRIYQKKDIDALVKKAVCSTVDRLDWSNKVKNYLSRQYAMNIIRPIAEDMKRRTTKDTFTTVDRAQYLDTSLSMHHPEVHKEFVRLCREENQTRMRILETVVVYVWGRRGD